MSQQQSRKILIIGTNMMNIYHHRLELIRSFLDSGYRVTVAAPQGGEVQFLEKIGCKFVNLPVDNRGTNIKNDLGLIKNLFRVYKKEKPDVILTFYTKTNIYGGIVARYMGIPYIENICGLGTSLAGEGLLSKLMGKMYRHALKRSSIVFFQNKSNIQFIEGKRIYNGRHILLPGSGVSLTRYKPLPYPKEEPIEFLFCSRILKEKGIEEYIEAARRIKEKYPNTLFHVVGPCEPQYIPIIDDAAKAEVIKYHGKVMDLHPILEKIHCTVLPSYYPEGMANILLESAASCRPVITTALPGCGETMEDNVTGFVVKEKNASSLSQAIEKFIQLSPEERERMGKEGRKKMEREFDRNIVVREYLKEINSILS